MKTIKDLVLPGLFILFVAACNNSKPKPVSNNDTNTTVTVNGKKDSVINNPEKNYGNATVSEPCVKCLLGIIQATKNYKMLTTSVPPENIIYDVNWITSKTPKEIGNGNRIINGMNIDIKLKEGGAPKKLVTYVYNNENAQFYVLNSQDKYDIDTKVDSLSLKKIRNSCFWGVASAK